MRSYAEEDVMKQLVGLMLMIGISMLYVQIAFAAEGCGHECASCHALSKEDAQKAIAKLPGTKVLRVADAPVRGLWELSVEQSGKKKVLYLDYGKQNIIQGKIISMNGKEAQPKKTDDGRVDMKGLDYSGALILGDQSAANRVAVFTDPNCPHCRMFHDEMNKIVQKRKDIAFVIFLYPLNPNPASDSYMLSQSVVCERSLKLLDDAYHGITVPQKSCAGGLIEKNIALGRKYRIDGTPAIVFPNGRINFGALQEKNFLNLFEKNRR